MAFTPVPGTPDALNSVPEQIQYLHARLNYIEKMLSEMHPNFPSDLDALCAAEVDKSGLTATQKTNVGAQVSAHKTRLRK